MKTRKVFVRGLNFHGQIGLGKKIKSTDEAFVENTLLPSDIVQVETNNGHSLVMRENKKTLYFFGFNWDLYTFYKTAAAFQNYPRFMWLVKNLIPTMIYFPCQPKLLPDFQNEIVGLDVGGAFALASDGK